MSLATAGAAPRHGGRQIRLSKSHCARQGRPSRIGSAVVLSTQVPG